MWSISKIFRVPIGHRLSKHKGLCQNYHGHNFVIKVCLEADQLNKNDMIMDFSDLKKYVGEVLEEFDHALVLNSYDDSMNSIDCKKVFLPEGDPTAERLAEFLYNELSRTINSICQVDDSNAINIGIKIKYVKVWENEDSEATYSK